MLTVLAVAQTAVRIPPTSKDLLMTSAPTYNLADLFELVVDAVPDRLALVAGDVRLDVSPAR